MCSQRGTYIIVDEGGGPLDTLELYEVLYSLRDSSVRDLGENNLYLYNCNNVSLFDYFRFSQGRIICEG